MKLYGVKPNQGTFGLDDPDVLRPGDPMRSVLLYRIAATGGAHMPRLGGQSVDDTGIRLVRDWIFELGDTRPPVNDAFVYDADLKNSERSLWLALSDLAAPQNVAVRSELAKHVGAMSPPVYDLFARFLPASARRRTLGERIDPAEILALKGDAAAGESLFFNNLALQCSNCHQVGGKGRSAGADLSHVAGRYSAAQILEAIVDPSKFVDPQFAAVSIETKAGDNYSGFILSRDAGQVILRELTGVDRFLSHDEIANLQPSRLSLMPTGLLAGLTAQEAADLVAYLVTLK
jgi:putative heme-binding domain-containing protein